MRKLYSMQPTARPLLALLAVCAAAHALAADPSPPRVQMTRGGANNNEVYMELHITVAQASPDCFQRDLILVNGLFQPTIELMVNDTVSINVFNELPKGFPQVADGITIHWHGFYMWHAAAWMDGAAYVTQCPISRTSNFTYRSVSASVSTGGAFAHGRTLLTCVCFAVSSWMRPRGPSSGTITAPPIEPTACRAL